MEHLLLVDGSNLLFQMFYGMPSRILAPDGRPVHGTLGFAGALLRSARVLRPTHALVVFDGECENPRAALDAAYKANRPDFSALPERETPFSQLPDIYAALDLLGVKHLETDGCEADDLIAAYALACRGGAQVTILSLDSDFFQLIDETVRVYRYRGDRSVLCTEEYVRARFGVRAAQYADFKCLVGDPSDNIPGVRGVGPKIAARLLARFETLEGVLAGAEGEGEWPERMALREAVAQQAQRLRTNRALIRLFGAAALPFPPEALACELPDVRAGALLRRMGLL